MHTVLSITFGRHDHASCAKKWYNLRTRITDQLDIGHILKHPKSCSGPGGTLSHTI